MQNPNDNPTAAPAACSPAAAPSPTQELTGGTDSPVQVIDQIGSLNQRLIVLKVCAIVLCYAGTSEVSIGGKNYTMRDGDLFVCRPNVMIEHSTSSANCACCGVLVPLDFFDRNLVFSGKMWDSLRFIDENPVIHLNAEECYMMRQYCSLIKAKLRAEPLRHHREIVDSLVRALIYELGDRSERFHKTVDTSYSSGENLFERFIRLIVGSYPKPREVKDYASKLCVTPKYLSAVCKMVTGKPASEIIGKYVLQDIEFHLRRKDKSIKEIATELGISNLSYFGKYVRRELGMSPRAYREKMLREADGSALV